MSRPVRRLAAACCLLTLLVPAAPAAAADEGCTRVAARDGSDSAAGTETAPFRTVQRLVASLGTGETGCLRAGDYPETSNGYVAKLAVPGVTLRSYAGERARLIGIVYVPATGAGTRLAHLAIEGTGASNTVKIYAPDVVVEDSDITNAHRGQSCMMLGNNGGAGAAARVIVRRNLFHACGNPANGNKDHAIYASNVEDGEIVDNVFRDPSAYAIQLYPNARRTRFAHNVVDGGASIRGGVLFGGDTLYASRDNVVEHNVLTYAATYGITTSWGGEVGTGNVARSNCVHGAKLGSLGGSMGYAAADTVTADPRFVNRAAGDYRLGAGSPCLAVVGHDTAARLAGTADAPPVADSAPEAAPEAPEAAPEAPEAATATAPEAAPEPPETAPLASLNLAPRVILTSPLAGATFTTTLRMTARASDDHGVVKVEFYVDGRLRATDAAAPYRAAYRVPRSRRAGSHIVTAKAYDGAGLASSASALVSGG